MKYGYIRVSTHDQETARQIDALESHCDEVVVEKVSANAKPRPAYEGLISKLQEGDCFVIVDLDRAYRSTIDALMEAERLRELKIDFKMLNFPIDTTTPEGELFYTIITAYGRFEKRMLQRRTKEGLEAARKRGKRLGRPKALSDEQVALARREIEAKNNSISGMANVLGVDRGTLSAALRE